MIILVFQHRSRRRTRHLTQCQSWLRLPNRHIGSFFKLSETERADLFSLLDQAKQGLDVLHQPVGYNIGINDGPAAGQTVPHLHIHLFPRFLGDLPDLRGGMR
jgi:diadenosine tetraphosphate (Ap4A) HIT family hydrolase